MLFNLRFFKRSGKWYMDQPHAVDGASNMHEVIENVRRIYSNLDYIIEIESAKDGEAETIFYPCLLL